MPNDNTDDDDIFQEILESNIEVSIVFENMQFSIKFVFLMKIKYNDVLCCQEPSRQLNNKTKIADTSVQKELPSRSTNANNIEMSEEVKARIEANRLKALERAAARKRALESQAS